MSRARCSKSSERPRATRSRLARARIGCALIGALLAFAAAGCASSVSHLPRSASLASPTVVLPTRPCDGHILVEVRINGRGPFAMVLDTGASVSAVTPEVARLFESDTLRAHFAAKGASSEEVRGDRVLRVRSLEAGGLTLSEFVALVVDLNDLSAHGVDGVLGYSAFRDVLLTIDYPHDRVTVRGGSLEPARDPATLAVVSRSVPRVPMRIGARTVDVLLDSGSDDALALAPADAVKYEIEPRAVGAAVTLGDAEFAHTGRAAVDAELAGVTLKKPLVSVSGASHVGSEVLKHFAVTFDQRAGLVRLEHREPGPLEFGSVYGMGVATRSTEGGLRVDRVVGGGPAERAGLKPGDVIVAIDGRSLAGPICARRELSDGQDLHLLTVRREGRTIELECELAALVR